MSLFLGHPVSAPVSLHIYSLAAEFSSNRILTRMVERKNERIENFEKNINLRFLCEIYWVTLAYCPDCPNLQVLNGDLNLVIAEIASGLVNEK